MTKSFFLTFLPVLTLSILIIGAFHFTFRALRLGDDLELGSAAATEYSCSTQLQVNKDCADLSQETEILRFCEPIRLSKIPSSV